MRIRTVIICIFFATLCLPGVIYGQISIEYINTNLGLPSEEINKIYQSSDGFIWIGTPQGLVRYDGYKMRVYSTSNSQDIGLITNQIKDIVEDKNNRLWLATNKGVAYFDLQTQSFTFLIKDFDSKLVLEDNDVNTIECDSLGQIWVGWAGYGVDVINMDEGWIKHFDSYIPNSGITSNWITDIYIDKNNYIWIGSWKGGICIYDHNINLLNTYSQITLPNNIILRNFSPFTFFNDSKGNYWLGTWDEGLIKFKFLNNQLIPQKRFISNQYQSNLSGNIVFDIIEGNDNKIWIATDMGLDHIDLKDSNDIIQNFHKSNNSIKHGRYNIITALLCDESGILWASTFGHGIEKINTSIKKFKAFNYRENIDVKGQITYAVTKSPDGDYLIGIQGSGFGKYDIETEQFTHYMKLESFNFLPDDINAIKCFKWDSAGNLWLGTRYEGLVKVDIKNRRYILINSENLTYQIPSREVNQISTDRNGFIWVATENGLYKIVNYSESFNGFNLIRYEHDPLDKHSLSSNNISAIFHDSNNNLWVSTFDKGVNRMISPVETHYPASFERYSYSSDSSFHIESNQINNLFEDSKGNLLLLTSGSGILKWNNDSRKFKRVFNTTQAIYDIQEDNLGFLWLSTNKGLIRLRLDKKEITFDHFTYENGLQGNNFIKEASFKDSDGSIFFGGYNGFNMFEPEKIVPDTFVPPIQITDLKVQNRSIVPAQYKNGLLNLKHYDNNISVEFVSLAYSNPSNNKYAYYLEGVDMDWRYVEAFMRNATYANLKPGKYILRIKGSNSSGLWNQNPLVLEINIKTAPLKSWWAIAIYLIVIGLISTFILLIYSRGQKLKKALAIEHIERTKSDKLNQFKQQLFTNIAHEFLTPITILYSVINNELEKNSINDNESFKIMKRNVEKLLRQVRQFLNYRKTETGNMELKVNKVDLLEFINNLCQGFEQLAKSKQIKFTHTIPEQIDECWLDIEKVESILHNLLSNAIKYTPSQGKIHLLLQVYNKNNSEYAEFKIDDTGKGIKQENLQFIFDRFYSVRSSSSKFSGFGIGLSLTKSLVEIHKGKIEVHSILKEGSCFKVTLPISQNNYSFDEIDNENKQHETFEQEQIELFNSTANALEIIKQVEKAQSQKYHILVVEDNDDFRNILKFQLSEFFKISIAENGITALKIAKDQFVDLVLSDVLMPEMDGFELCQKLKESESTCHIPVILLTAKISEEDRAEGYKLGADSYLTKPFSLNTLVLRIQSLIGQRHILLNKFTKGIIEGENKGCIQNADEKFLICLKKAVEANISDVEFSVKKLSEIVGVSSSMLYRKTKSLIGITPIDYIKQIRLLKAASLLTNNPDFTISEVAYESGFNDISYFGACFKKHFGIPPSEYNKTTNVII